MQVLKFGGTSVGSVESIKQVIQIIENHRHGGRPDSGRIFGNGWVLPTSLSKLGEWPPHGETDYMELVRRIEDRHFNVVKGLFP